jgi:hypothetical protein
MNLAIRRKVQTIFGKLIRESERKYGYFDAMNAIEEALADEYPLEVAKDIAWHLTDWRSDAEVMVAITLFPERFTPDEIRGGVKDFLYHAPNHIAAAAKLAGQPVTDRFKIGALDGIEEDQPPQNGHNSSIVLPLG